jgi:hypothetical protein
MQAKKLTQTLLGLLIISSLANCAPAPITPNATGRISFKLAFPVAAKQTDFALKAIPSGTRRFEIEISGEGMTEPRKITLTAQGETEKKETVADLPVGTKTVSVTAFDESKALASASQDVVIKASETSSAEFDLRSVLFNLSIKLPQAVPIAIPIEAKISGDHVPTAGLTLTGNFAAGNPLLALGEIPEGNKQISLYFNFKLNNQEIKSEAIVKTLIGKAGVASQLEISLNEIANALVPVLLKQNLADLPNLLNQIPPDLVELLRKNPLIAAFLLTRPSPVPTAQPTPEPTPQPSTQPTAIPSPTATPANQELKLEILDGRVALRPLSLIKDSVDTLVSETDPNIRLLTPNNNLQVPLNSRIFAAIIRLNYNGTDKPELNIQIKNLSDANAPINGRSFPAALTNKGVLPNRYNSLILLLQEDGSAPILDTPALYKVTVEAKANEGKLINRAVFQVKVLPAASAN